MREGSEDLTLMIVGREAQCAFNDFTDVNE